MDWLKRPRALALTAALLLQIAVLHGVSRLENTPSPPPLSSVPRVFGAWTLAQEGAVDQTIQEALKADDLLSRMYRSPDGPALASLFVAYFRTQRTGATPHSPKHCLPGSGWVPDLSDKIPISVPGRPDPIQVNRYLVSKGDARSVVLYWYQSHGRVVAGEFEARCFRVVDAIRYNRTDTALVRVVLPVAGEDVERTTRTAAEFVRAMFGPLSPFVGG